VHPCARGIRASVHVIASIDDPVVIEKILTHIEKQNRQPKGSAAADCNGYGLENEKIICKDAVSMVEICADFAGFSEQRRRKVAIFRLDFQIVCGLSSMLYTLTTT
jgi:hypothetical protein